MFAEKELYVLCTSAEVHEFIFTSAFLVERVVRAAALGGL